MMRIDFQYETGRYTLLGINGSLPTNRTGKVRIDGKEYQTETVYDLPNHIAIIGNGNFKGKEIEFV